MWKLQDKYAIAGIGYTDFTKNSGRTVRSLASEACLAAAADAAIDINEIDGLCSFHMGDSAPGIAVATELGIPDVKWAVDLYAGGNAANLIVSNAAAAIEAGMAKNVLCFRAMNGRSGFRFGGGQQAMIAAGGSQWSAPFGLMTYGQMMAMWCQRYKNRYGLKAEQLGTIATTFRDNALRNPRAMQKTSMTMVDYLNSKMIVEPFRVFDICLETDGACAVLVTSAERARDLRTKPVYITSAVYGGGPSQGEDLAELLRWPDISHNGFKYLADDLWGAAGIRPGDLDFAEIYDCFTYSVLMALEGLGFCKEGEAGDWIQGGRIAKGGEMPLNTNGGLLSEGYIHGFNHVIEAVQQLRGEAGERQVPDAKIGLTTAGAMTVTGALVLRN
jgi:acetyl-CoA acetyltransferase